MMNWEKSILPTQHMLRRRAVPTWGVFLNEEEQGGGPLIDIGTHALDLTLWMMDNYEVQSVTGAFLPQAVCIRQTREMHLVTGIRISSV